MSEMPPGVDPLIDQFFKMLNHLQFEQANMILAEMRTKMVDYAHYDLWSTYLAGVLEQEKNRDWAKAERIFQQVAAANPQPKAAPQPEAPKPPPGSAVLGGQQGPTWKRPGA